MSKLEKLEKMIEKRIYQLESEKESLQLEALKKGRVIE